MSPDDAGDHLRAADALLVALRASLTDVISSKLFDYCAMKRPVIVAADGETEALGRGSGVDRPAGEPAGDSPTPSGRSETTRSLPGSSPSEPATSPASTCVRCRPSGSSTCSKSLPPGGLTSRH